jgi:hypothetical protein
MALVAARAARNPGAELGTTIRLFVSSTCADFQIERDLLQRHVFPYIREVCRAEAAVTNSRKASGAKPSRSAAQVMRSSAPAAGAEVTPACNSASVDARLEAPLVAP